MKINITKKEYKTLLEMVEIALFVFFGTKLKKTLKQISFSDRLVETYILRGVSQIKGFGCYGHKFESVSCKR